MLDFKLLPKKLNDICLFKKAPSGSVLYSFNEKLENRNDIIICRLTDFDFDVERFEVHKSALEMLIKLQATDVKITEKSFIIKSAKGKYTAKLLDVPEPTVHLPKENTISLDVKYLNKASNYVANNNSKPILNGVYCDNFGNIVATDSFKAYSYNGGVEETPAEKQQIVVPVSFIKTVNDNFGVGVYTARFDNQSIVIAKENTVIVSSLYQGNYPNVEKLLSTTTKNVIVYNVDVKQLLECLDISKNCAENDSKNVIAVITNNHFKASGENEFESDIDFSLNDEYKIILSGDNLSKGLKSLEEYEKINGYALMDEESKTANMILFLPDNNENEKILLLGIRQ